MHDDVAGLDPTGKGAPSAERASDRPLVVCVGTAPEQFGSIVRHIGRSAVVLLAADPQAAVQLLEGLTGPEGHSGTRPLDTPFGAGHSSAGHSSAGHSSAGHPSAGYPGAKGEPNAHLPRVLEAPAGADPATPRRADAVEVGALRMDERIRRVEWRDQPIQLSERQFDLLLALARDAGRVWTFAELTQSVWRRRYVGDDDAVTSAVKRLRRRLGEVTAELLVESVRGVGYRLTLLTAPPAPPADRTRRP